MRSLFHTIMGRGGAPFTYLLDDYPNAEIAFSMFKLRTAYSGNCIRVRRSSDNIEQDIGFVNNLIDTASLTSFIGANTGYVVTMYDQSGNARNATQASASVQPTIINSGTLITRNGIPTIETPTLKGMVHSALTYNTDDVSIFMDYEKSTTANAFILGVGSGYYMWLDYGANQYVEGSSSISGSWNANTHYLMSSIYDRDVNTKMYKNATLLGSTTVPSNTLMTLAELPNLIYRSATVYNSMFVVYRADQTANRANIETIINDYYGIY